MRTLIVIAVFALVGAPAASAESKRELAAGKKASAEPQRELAAGGKPLSLTDGRGVAVVKGREGVILGSVVRGRVRATNARVAGCESRKRVSRSTVVCIGRNLHVSATGRRWRVVLSGWGINASGKLKGVVTLQGRSGTYSLEPGGADPRPWPRSPQTFRLG